MININRLSVYIVRAKVVPRAVLAVILPATRDPNEEISMACIRAKEKTITIIKKYIGNTLSP